MVYVKVCGITNTEDAETALRYGADWLGFIVDVPVETPRKLSLVEAKKIIQKLGQAKTVLVMMPQKTGELEKAAKKIRPWGIQLHGNETPDFVSNVRKTLPDVKIIKTVHVKTQKNLNLMLNEIRKFEEHVDFILLDTLTDKVGGTGVAHDWAVSRRIRESASKPIILAGGLTPENVCEAVGQVKPHAVDVASGVESAPGKKDPQKIRKFIVEARKCST